MMRTWLCFLAAVMALSLPSGVPAAAGGGGSPVPKGRIVSVDDLHRKWREVSEKKSGAVLLDVRTEEEFRGGHVPGAVNISSSHPEKILKKLPDRNAEIWVHCRSGRRALAVAEYLYRHGYRNVYTVDGGVPDWEEKGYPLAVD